MSLGASDNRIGLVRRHSTVCSGVSLGASAKLLANLNVAHCECAAANTVLTRKRLLCYMAVDPARVLI